MGRGNEKCRPMREGAVAFKTKCTPFSTQMTWRTDSGPATRTLLADIGPQSALKVRIVGHYLHSVHFLSKMRISTLVMARTRIYHVCQLSAVKY